MSDHPAPFLLKTHPGVFSGSTDLAATVEELRAAAADGAASASAAPARAASEEPPLLPPAPPDHHEHSHEHGDAHSHSHDHDDGASPRADGAHTHTHGHVTVDTSALVEIVPKKPRAEARPAVTPADVWPVAAGEDGYFAVGTSGKKVTVISGLEVMADTMEELTLRSHLISSMDGVQTLSKLTKLELYVASAL